MLDFQRASSLVGLLVVLVQPQQCQLCVTVCGLFSAGRPVPVPHSASEGAGLLSDLKI